jgi:hypothetical protein
LDESAVSRGLKIVSALATVGALVRLCCLAVFMADPSQVAFSFAPSSAFETAHSCLTAYYFAAQAVDEGKDAFDPSLYTAPGDTGVGLRKPRLLGPFRVDVYEYPPPFLLLPRAFMALTPDFMRLRPLWFAFDLAVLVGAMLVTARWLGPAAGTRALLLIPLVVVALPTSSLLQKGNVQGVIIAMSVLAMGLFERKRAAAGGALLAFAIASKLYPGLLVVPLLVRREWRALAWTAGFGVVYMLATLAYAGPATYVAFLHHLPGLLGGEAFPAFRNPSAIAINYSIPGLAFKAKLFGVPGMGFGAAKLIGWIWTVFILWIVARGSRRATPPQLQPLIWLGILTLGTLRSPFLPSAYGGLPPLWLLVLLAALSTPTTRTLCLTLAGWTIFNLYWPQDWPMDPRVLAILTTVPQALTLGLALWVFKPAPVRERPGLPAAVLLPSPAA